jgi:hypothetical protein
MKIAGGISENGIVVGNTCDKYGSRNPLVRKIMRGFGANLMELVGLARARMAALRHTRWRAR